MSLGQTLKSYMKSDSKQTHLAASWLEGWKKQSPGKTWTQDTITSHLNRCFQDNPQGIRFFFITDRARGTLLLELLNVPTQVREDIFEQARRMVSTEGVPPQMIVDATAWIGDVSRTAALFEAIERQLVTPGPFPIALLILEEQFKHLPRTYDTLQEQNKVRFERFKEPNEAWNRLQELAEEQGLVISARRFGEVDRWLAAEFDGRSLQFAPPEGRSEFQQSGRLSSLSEVVNDLSLLVPAGSEVRAALPDNPLSLRRLMVALRSEEGAAALKISAPQRQGYGLQLGMAVASTPRERLEADISTLGQKLPIPIQEASPEKLAEARIQASRRGLEPLALRVGNSVHLINVDSKLTEALGKPSWLHVESIPILPSPLHRLLQAVSSWNEDDFLDDPFLEHLIERLDPSQQERLGFLHARAGLLFNQALPIKAASPVVDWQPALTGLLATDPPAASLRVRLASKLIDFVNQERPAFAVPLSFAQRTNVDWPLRQVPPLSDVILDREDNLVEVHACEAVLESEYGYGSSRRTPDILLPATREAALDTGFWLDLYEAWQEWKKEEARSRSNEYYSDRRRKPERYEALWSSRREHLLQGAIRTWQATEYTFAPSFWEEADRELATLWLALRRSVARAPHVRLPDGSVLLQLNPAVLANIRVTQRSEPRPGEPLRASLLYEPVQEGNKPVLSPFFTVMAPTHAVNKGYTFGPLLPRGLYIRGERFNADIRFRVSAVLSPSLEDPLAAVAAVTQTRDEEEARQQQQQDDDDD
ncbi:hypothetical protein SAMN05444354_110303 [Stigmatella aurantiaca]|uniref:Uncharacterized protein n=1 Tax=Stigmatella aurantiaca TaxID=41 RepID=A0A1H7V1R2_STIAU|nr:hypothetical protein [Stigmatella aurantiaca]SEM03152.1 hypothetical protein SAMN05444354_110303 [Stigmatella aurantiaca]